MTGVMSGLGLTLVAWGAVLESRPMEHAGFALLLVCVIVAIIELKLAVLEAARASTFAKGGQ